MTDQEIAKRALWCESCAKGEHWHWTDDDGLTQRCADQTARGRGDAGYSTCECDSGDDDPSCEFCGEGISAHWDGCRIVLLRTIAAQSKVITERDATNAELREELLRQDDRLDEWPRFPDGEPVSQETFNIQRERRRTAEKSNVALTAELAQAREREEKIRVILEKHEECSQVADHDQPCSMHDDLVEVFVHYTKEREKWEHLTGCDAAGLKGGQCNCGLADFLSDTKERA